MEGFRVQIPDGVKVRGVTADGRPTAILPGEYFVHDIRPKLPSAGTLLRFVGADALCRDVHVPRESVQRFMSGSSAELVGTESMAAA